MINLFLDTDILIGFIAKDKPSGILELLIEKIGNNSISIVTNSIIKTEWDRNKTKTISGLQKAILNEAKSALKISEFLSHDDKQKLESVLTNYAEEEKSRLDLIEDRISKIDKLLEEAVMIEITNGLKLEVIDLALEKKAPFNNKNNSVGDALNLLSLVAYLKEQGTPYSDTIFVSYNHTDFGTKENPDEIHPDLKPHLEEVQLVYKRNIGEALNLSNEMIVEIESYIDDYVDSMVDDYIQDQIDIRRGK